MAREMIDLLLKENEDVAIEYGDFVMAESTGRHQQQLLMNDKGDYKENPTVGVGLLRHIDAEDYRSLVRAVQQEFSRDGMETTEIALEKDGTIRCNANYQ